MSTLTINPLFGELVRASSGRKRLLATIFVGVNVLTWITFSFVPRSYQASALIQINFAPSYDSDSKRDAEAILRDEQYLNSQTAIIHSEHVIRDAISAVGPSRLYEPDADIVHKIRTAAGYIVPQWIWSATSAWDARPYIGSVSFPASADAADAPPADKIRSDEAFLKASAALSVHPEPKTDLIRVSFSHPDRQIAAEFVNALVQMYLSRHVQLMSQSNASAFMESERKKYEYDFDVASLTLNRFSVKNNMYSIEEQLRLALDRRKEIQSNMEHTLGRIAQLQAEIRETSQQLVALKLNNLSPQLAELARKGTQNAGGAQNQGHVNSDLTGPIPTHDPPLLLVRVYQETAQSLVNKNAELVGLRELIAQQKQAYDAINHELSDVSAQRAQFEQLRRNVELAKQSANSFALKEIEQRTELALGAQKLLRLEVVQEATAPLKPGFPTRTVIITSGLLLSIVAMAGVAGRLLVVGRRKPATSKIIASTVTQMSTLKAGPV